MHVQTEPLTRKQVNELRKLYDQKVFGSKPSTFRADWTRILDALATIDQYHDILVELIRVIDSSAYGEDSIHHHTCPAPDHGKCSCGAHAVIDGARKCLRYYEHG